MYQVIKLILAISGLHNFLLINQCYQWFLLLNSSILLIYYFLSMCFGFYSLGASVYILLMNLVFFSYEFSCYVIVIRATFYSFLFILVILLNISRDLCLLFICFRLKLSPNINFLPLMI